MRLAIADPPYLGRAALWYGGGSATRRPKSGPWRRSKGRPEAAPEFHPEAARWDDPGQHIDLMARMEADFDGWAMAASGKSLGALYPCIDQIGARVAIWHVTNAIPDGARVRSVWEAVVFRVPTARRAVGTGYRVPDLLSYAHPMSGFVGAKPDAWTRWVLDLLGYQPGDEVDDLFPGSGAVSAAMDVLL